jgi:hypothetical protein
MDNNAHVIPLIHVNGTSGERLRDEVFIAYGAVGTAVQALTDAAPNARDYYPLGADAFRAAQTAHDARVRRLMEIKDELSKIYMGIQDQLDR